MLRIFLPILGAVIYRLRGSKYNVRPVFQMWFAVTYAYLVLLEYNLIASFLILAITTLAVCVGHGRFISLDAGLKDTDPECIECLMTPFQGLSDYWYKVLGLSLTGLLITLPRL